jgi:hypothetical protein
MDGPPVAAPERPLWHLDAVGGAVHTIIPEPVLSDSKGLRRHVKRRSFSQTFKALGRKRQTLPNRIATLSQHLSFIRVSF